MNHTQFVLKAKTLFLPALLLSISLFAWTSAHAQITPSADSYTNTATPTTNNGAKILLDVDGATQTTYIQFNLASIPSGASISQATLKLYVNSVTTAGSFNVDYVNSSWSESTIDASNAPTPGTTIASNVNVTTADKNQYILINVTSAVQAWLSGTETNNGLALVANSTFDATFDSKENTGTSHPPELDIAYAGGDGAITGVTTASGSGLTGGGTSGNLNLSLTNACSANQVLQWNGSAWACSAAGTGTITGVAGGPGLLGGATSGNAILNLDPTVVPILAANNNFTGNNLFTPSGATDAIDAYTSGPGKTGVVAIENATSGGSYGVWARTADPAGAGVFGTNVGGAGGIGVSGTGDTGVYASSSTGNNAMVANGNASQNRTGGGWLKAAVFVNGITPPYNIVHCFNSALSGSAATTPPCGITLTEVIAGGSSWCLNFGFEVDDRFISANFEQLNGSSVNPSLVAQPGCLDLGNTSLLVFNSQVSENMNFWVLVF
jgi:hypothetical protein